MSNYEHFIACISVEEKEALDYAKQNHLQFESCEQWLSTCVEPLEDKGISLLSSASVSGSDWGRYLAYLADWAMEHTDPRFVWNVSRLLRRVAGYGRNRTLGNYGLRNGRPSRKAG